jgi:hypothetical protein
MERRPGRRGCRRHQPPALARVRAGASSAVQCGALRDGMGRRRVAWAVPSRPAGGGSVDRDAAVHRQGQGTPKMSVCSPRRSMPPPASSWATSPRRSAHTGLVKAARAMHWTEPQRVKLARPCSHTAHVTQTSLARGWCSRAEPLRKAIPPIVPGMRGDRRKNQNASGRLITGTITKGSTNAWTPG